MKRVENCYSTFDIPKKSGGKRTICAPNDNLKDIQKKIASALWKRQQEVWKRKRELSPKGFEPKISHAFEKKKSIITNANVHRNKRFVLNVDLENFFDSFHFGRVKGFFEKNKDFCMGVQAATAVAQLTCVNGRLPQGAPSSPIITNLICQILDIRILQVAKRYKLDYTRYADDLTFSTNARDFLDDYLEFFQALKKEIERAGFCLNEKKTRMQFNDSRQVVTGLTVNKKINVNRDYVIATRAMANSLYKTGEFLIGNDSGSLDQLEGRFSFINQLDRYNNIRENPYKTVTQKKNYKSFNSREKEYQKFLFYKYFYQNDKLLIITEGETDPCYLKAALKNLHEDYPTLVSKNDDGTFQFHISFLRRTKRLKYFFELNEGGADALHKIYLFFKVEKNFPNYFKFFEAENIFPKNQVILLIDNEMNNGAKPLATLLNKFGEAKSSIKKELEKHYYCKLIDKKNLYLMTIPLVKDLLECEIEDMFEEETLDTIINGKTFDRELSDKEKHYGKVEFSNFIANNYNEVNFDAFKPVLNNIVKIQQS